MLMLVPIDKMLIIGLVLGGMILIVVMAHLHDQRRRKGIAALFEGRGFAVDQKPGPGEKAQAFASFSPIDQLKQGSNGIRWSARGRIDGVAIEAIEHTYSVGSGKNRHTVVNFCVAAVGGSEWPLLMLTGESVLNRLGEKLGARADLKLEDEQFNRRWRIRCDDEGFALAALSPELQAVLRGGDSKEWWAIGGRTGVVCRGMGRTPTPALVQTALDRLSEAMNALPPEVKAGLGVGRVT